MMRKKHSNNTRFAIKLFSFVFVSMLLMVTVGVVLVSGRVFASPVRLYDATPTLMPTVSNPLPTPIQLVLATTTPQPTMTVEASPTITETPLPDPIISSCLPPLMIPTPSDTSGSQMLSPGRFFIGFSETRNDNMDIYYRDGEGTFEKRLTDHPAEDNHPMLMSATNQMVFYSKRDGNGNIYIMNSDGSDQRPLTTDPSEDTAYAVSPNQAFISFTTDRDGTNNIYVMNSDGSDQRPLTTHPGSDKAGMWSSDGTQILFVSDRDHEGQHILYLMNADGSNQRPLVADLKGDSDSPEWSPDGSKIAFVITHEGKDEIFTINSDGSHLCQLTNDNYAQSSPAWVSNTEILYVDYRDSPPQIYSMFADGSYPHPLNKSEPQGEVTAVPSSTPVPLIAPTALPSPSPMPTENLELKKSLRIAGADNVGRLSEGIRLRNESQTLLLKGWTLSDENGHIYTFPDVRVFSQAEIVVFTTSGVDTPLAYFWDLTSPVWKQGETITLKDAQGNVIDTMKIGEKR